ncbi:MAG TPA: ATP:cob(I)alamin adenosyltransferase, partial [Bacillota bacterium]|nr:ATP:cob(I)alamin adenosyltransferase [Bacillota bacterium]
ESFPKDDPLFEAMGTLDELSAVLGLCYHERPLPFILEIQRALLAINAGLAWTPTSGRPAPSLWQDFGGADIQKVETEEQRWLDQKPLAIGFTLLGSEDSRPGAYFNLSRAVCRRAERRVVSYLRHSQRTDLTDAAAYLNRLSDLLFLWTKNA